MTLHATVVIHHAALGDFVLTWSALRHWKPCTIVTASEKGRLAASLIDGVFPVEIESPLWNAMWVDDPALLASHPAHPEVARVVSYLGAPESTWHRNARLVFPEAIIDFPRTGSETLFAPPDARPIDPDHVIIHVGAGADEKRWSMCRTLDLVVSCVESGLRVTCIAGEVERERLTARDRSLFEQHGGSWIDCLSGLADMLLDHPGIYVGFDTGPTHLAAFLGLPTIAIFGPTDPREWRPNGAQVTVITPESARGPVESVSPAEVMAAIDAFRFRFASG